MEEREGQVRVPLSFWMEGDAAISPQQPYSQRKELPSLKYSICFTFFFSVFKFCLFVRAESHLPLH